MRAIKYDNLAINTRLEKKKVWKWDSFMVQLMKIQNTG